MESIPFNDPYFQQSFNLDHESLKKFYRFSIRTCYDLYFNKYYVSIFDFEDVFQESICKLIIAIQSGRYVCTTNEAANRLLSRFFRNKSIDFLRRKKSEQKRENTLKENMNIEEFELVSIAEENKDIGSVFNDIDKKLSSNPNDLSKKQFEFYKIYKEAFFQYSNEKEIKFSVMEKMGISEGYFGKLKTEIVYYIKKHTDRE